MLRSGWFSVKRGEATGMHDSSRAVGFRLTTKCRSLRSRKIQEMIDRTGDKYGFLIVEGLAGRTPQGMFIWTCRCACGKITPVRHGNLRNGHTTSCGCQKGGKGPRLHPKHGHSAPSRGGRSPEYRSYSAAKERCNNSHNHNYPKYGTVGIRFMFDSFKEFFATLGPRPEGTTCDRYPNPAGNYEPGNVRWATPIQQRHNRRAS